MNLKSNIKTKYIGTKELEISEHNKKICNFYSITEKSNKKPQVTHHIILIDLSLSMTYELPELRKKLDITLDTLRKRKNNYVSVIAYSGHNQCYRLINGVKCDTISYKMANVYETLEKELYSRGLTVISEPLDASIEIATTLFETCQKHNIILFTDGCVVPTKWSCEDEISNCYSLASLCSAKGIFLNAIGFGNFYDKQFLNNLVLKGPGGNFYHISEITDFSKTIINIHDKLYTTSLANCDISNSNYFILNQKTFFSGKNLIKNIDSNKGTTLVVFDEDLNLDNKIISSKRKVNLSPDIESEFLYALTYHHIMNEDIESAEYTISKTGDIFAYNKIANCYSIAEKGYCLKLLQELISNNDKRFKDGKTEIKLTSIEDEPLCLLEILDYILKDSNSKLLWNYSYKYSRIGAKKVKVEDNYKFIYPKFGFGEITAISIGSKKLNIGIKVKIDGQVINTNNNLKLDAHVFREYNLVHNGNINTPTIWCTLSPELRKLLRKNKLIKSPLKTIHGTIYTLDLTKVKSTNKRLLKSLSSDDIATILNEIEVLSCKQWAIKKHINLISSSDDFKQPYVEGLSKEIIATRADYRVDEKGVYSPLLIEEVASNTEYELYKARVLEWKVQGFPKTKTQEEALDYYSKFISKDKQKSYLDLTNELFKVRDELLLKRNKMNIVRLSCGLSNRSPFLWENEIEKDKREWDKNLNINMIVDDKLTISTKVVNNIKIRQDKFEILTKIN